MLTIPNRSCVLLGFYPDYAIRRRDSMDDRNFKIKALNKHRPKMIFLKTVFKCENGIYYERMVLKHKTN